MLEDNLEEIEISIAEVKKTIKNADDILAFMAMPLFKRVIEEMYFKDEAVRLVSAKSNFAMQSEESQRFLDGSIMGIGGLQQFINKELAIGMTARNTLESYEANRAELLSEDVEEA